MSKILNSGLCRERDSRRLFQISGAQADTWGGGVRSAGVPFFPTALYSFQPRFLRTSSGRWTAMPPHLWPWHRSTGLREFESKCPSRAFFFNLAWLGCLSPASLGVPEKEAEEDSYTWLFHWLWWSFMTWLHSLCNSDPTLWRSPFHASYQGMRSIPLSIKIHFFVFPLLPNKNKVTFLLFPCHLRQPGVFWTLPREAPQSHVHIGVCVLYAHRCKLYQYGFKW